MIAISVQKFKLGGEFRFTALDGATRRVLRRTPWMRNLLTDGGMDRIGNSAGVIATYCAIGTGNTPPAFADSQLVSLSASTSNQVTSSSVNMGAPNYESRHSITYEFALGAVNGNMAEVGVGWGPTTLFSRALTVDGGGTPTTIPVGVTEILQVSWRLTVYPDLSDHTGTISISGDDYDFTARHYNAASLLFQFALGAGLPWSGVVATSYAGAIGAVTGSPSGTTGALGSTNAAYTPGTHYRDFTVTGSIAQSNIGGIMSMTLNVVNNAGGGGGGSMFRTQVEFDPPIPKDGTNALSLPFRQSWARH